MLPQSTLYPRDVSNYGTERMRSLVGLISLPNTQGVLCLQAPDGNEFYIFQDGLTPSFGGVNEVMAGTVGAVGCHIGAAVTPAFPPTSMRDGLTIIGSRRLSSSLAIAASDTLSGALGMMTGFGNIGAFLYLHKTATNTWQLMIGTEAQFLADAGGTAVGTPVVGSGAIDATRATLGFERHEGRTIIGGNKGKDRHLPGVMFIESAGRGAGLAFEYGTDDETGAVTSPAVVMYFPDAVTAPAFVQPLLWLQWNAMVVVLTTSLPGATHGVPYTATLSAQSGGTSPTIWSLFAGSLPAGLALSPSGIISGTPTTAGTVAFTVSATTAQCVALGGVTSSQALSIVVA
jgi:hypothetical protein